MTVSLSIPRKAKRNQASARRRNGKSACIVYVLKEHAGGPPRYVGQTRCLPEVRLTWHFKGVARKLSMGEKLSPAQAWVHSLMLRDQPPILEVIDRKGIWDISEAVWIDRLRHHGLLNRNALVG